MGIVAVNGGSSLEGRYRALLFDMDGTVLNSIAVAERIWGAWAIDHGVDVETFLPTIHGVRSVDTIAALQLPGINPEIEAQGITRAEIATVDGNCGNFWCSKISAVAAIAPLGYRHFRSSGAGHGPPEGRRPSSSASPGNVRGCDDRKARSRVLRTCRSEIRR
jgi:hypothetical protein